MRDYARSVHVGISIHALREEGDAIRLVAASALLHISIHALREEGDGNMGFCG